MQFAGIAYASYSQRFVRVYFPRFHQRLSQGVGGMNSSREQDSSVGGDAGYVCLGAVHMEEKVQDRVQMEVGREEQGEEETHGKEQSEEQRERTDDQSTAHHG